MNDISFPIELNNRKLVKDNLALALDWNQSSNTSLSDLFINLESVCNQLAACKIRYGVASSVHILAGTDHVQSYAPHADQLSK